MKRIAFACLTASLFMGLVATQAQNQVANNYQYNADYDYRASEIIPYRFNADELVDFAKQYLGVAYVSNGKDGNGFDCSGFTFYVFKNFGVYLPYYSAEQAEIGQEVSVKEARKGDLICFKGYNLGDYQAGHVGIVTSQPGQKLTWIHASSSKGVSMATLDNGYYKARFLTIRRVAF